MARAFRARNKNVVIHRMYIAAGARGKMRPYMYVRKSENGKYKKVRDTVKIVRGLVYF